MGAAAAGFADLVELLEDARLMFAGDANARVDDVDRDLDATQPGSDQHAAGLGITYRVRDQIAHDALEQRGIAAHRDPGGGGAQRKSLGVGLRLEFRDDAREQRRDGDAYACRVQRARFEARQIEQLFELPFERGHGALHAADQRSPFGFGCARGQRRDVEPDRVQRLPQVVARRGQELALGAIGGLGGGTRVMCGARLALELLDEVDVLVTHCQRSGQHVIQLMPEGENEAQHDRHHERRVQVNLVAFQRDAHDKRNQRR